jgi:hypothetical protein
MELKAHEKEALNFQLCTLLEHDEPRAILATLHRIAENKARSFTKARSVDYEAALSWHELAEALHAVKQELERRAASQVTDI